MAESKMAINRDTYRKIKKMDHKEFNNWFVGVYDRAYKAGRREAFKLTADAAKKAAEKTSEPQTDASPETEKPFEAEEEDSND